LWWSIAATNIKADRTWFCPWCGHKHVPPHKDRITQKLPNEVANQRSNNRREYET